MRRIEAQAVISAKDATGAVIEKMAAKFKGLGAAAKAAEGIKPTRFTGNLFEELKRLGLAEKQMQKVRDEMRAFDRDLKAQRPSFTQYLRAHGDFADKQAQNWRKIKTSTEEAHRAQQRFQKGSGVGMMGAAAIGGAGFAGYYAGRAAHYAFDKSREANRETTKQRLSGLTQAQSDAISAEAERQSKMFPTISQTELRSAGREAVMQMGSQEQGMKMMPSIARFMTTGKVLWGEDKIDEQTRKALQVLDARQITDPDRADRFLNQMVKASQVEGGPDYTGDDLRKAVRRGGEMVRGQSDRFVTSVLPQMGVDLGYETAGASLASMHSALIGGRQTKAALAFQKKAGARDKNGKLFGDKLLTSDVDRWIDQYYIPTLIRNKVDPDDAAAVGNFNSKFFSQGRGAMAAGNLVSGRQQRLKRDEQQKLAKGTAGAETLHTQDVGSALDALNAQLANTASNAKLAEAAIATLNGAMGLVQKMGEELNKPGGWFDKGKKQFEQEKDDASAVGKFVGKVFQWDQEKTGTKMPWLVPKWIRDRPYPVGEDPMTAGQGAPGLSSPYPAGGDPMGGDYSRRAFHSKEYWARMYPPQSQPSSPFGSPDASTPAWNWGVPSMKDGQVQAELTGSAEVTGEVAATFTASSELITLVGEARKAIALVGKLNTNGPGSTGRSSPDAEAP